MSRETKGEQGDGEFVRAKLPFEGLFVKINTSFKLLSSLSTVLQSMFCHQIYDQTVACVSDCFSMASVNDPGVHMVVLCTL